ncbi:MAG: energy-coupling factor transporter transmembrane protein EcfT [Helicobacteraceae bacterium]|jgi:cobalt/nickel transport system permease protein|nr:energy-coupling factor transporter transmembrane protein EcfT [Helicobacteraceae bacterium]
MTIKNNYFAEKLIALVIYSIAVAPINVISPAIFVLPIALAAINFRDLLITLKRLVFLNLFIAVIAASLYFWGDKEEALLIFVRSNLILFVSLIFFARSNENEIAIALAKLKLPAKVISTIFFSLKIIVLLKYEFSRFRRALLLREFTLKANRRSYKIIGGFLATLLLRAIERSEKLEKTMLLRGFNGKIHSLTKEKISAIYLAFFAALATLAFVKIPVIF